MLLKALPLLLTIGIALAVTPMETRIDSERTLMDFMLMPRAADPVLQQYCFNRYLPQLKQMLDDLENDFKACQDVYDVSASSIDAKFSKKREDFTAISKASCQSLQKCYGVEASVDAFDCFGKTGLEQSNILLAMSGDSNEAAGEIKEEYYVIESTRGICNTRAQNTYNDNSSKTYDEMSKCLDGIVVTPQPTTPPTDTTV